jgi:diadenosine tetraphosphate (Ap4A) HIT family hydrolase
MLIIPFRHVADYFETTVEEKRALFELLDRAKALIDEQFAPAGYNVGINIGATAGQTVMHVHVHLIPRYPGDVIRPRGGVRGVIPDKQSY